MTYEAYIRNIHQKTGLTPEEFRRAAEPLGLKSVGEAIKWAKATYGLGHGHANTIAHLIINPEGREVSSEEKMELVFAGAKRQWRPACDALIAQVQSLGDDASLHVTRSYISFLRSASKFGLIEIASGLRANVGIKLRGAKSKPELEVAGTWNSSVTHRIRVDAPNKLTELAFPWLAIAYELAG